LLWMFPVPMWLMKRTKSYQAKQYLDQVIGEKIDELKRNGPDGSTASAMVYAEDEEEDHPSLRLSRQQIIDNIYVLLVAGSETSSNTLTNAMLLLGLNPSVWNKLVAEQEELVAKHGDQNNQRRHKGIGSPVLGWRDSGNYEIVSYFLWRSSECR